MSQLKQEQKLKKQGSEIPDDQSVKSKRGATADNFKHTASRETKLKPVLISSTPGNAIMGYAIDETAPKKLPPLKEIKEISGNKAGNPNLDLESRVESSIIAMLQNKCSELGKEVEEDKALRKQAEVENSMMKSHITNLEQELRYLTTLLNDEKAERSKVEDNLDNMKDMCNKANREIGRLKQDVKAANDNTEGLKRQLNELQKEKDNEARGYESEIDRLRKHLEELEEEHEELRSKFQIKSDVSTRVDQERSKHMTDIANKTQHEIEAKLEKINKLISENATLSERLAESDKMKRRYQERHAIEEEKIKSLAEKNQVLEESIVSLKKQLADAKSLKSYNHKIYEEKIVTLNDQIEKLKKDNAKLKKSNNNVTASPNGKTAYDDDNEEILSPVKAKPFLFGPVDTGKY